MLKSGSFLLDPREDNDEDLETANLNMSAFIQSKYSSIMTTRNFINLGGLLMVLLTLPNPT